MSNSDLSTSARSGHDGRRGGPEVEQRPLSRAAELSSLEKGLLILSELVASSDGMPLGRLARETGLNRTTTYRLCEILERGGWIQDIGRTPSRESPVRVDIGPRLLGMAVLITNKHDPEARLRPIIERLAESVSEAVHVGMLEGIQVVHIARAFPSSGLNMAAQVGAREFAHVTALGKALLATRSDEEIVSLYGNEPLPGRTARSIRSRKALLDELAETRARGYAIDDEESSMGVRCLGAPVFDSSGRGVLAISITTNPARLGEERLDDVVRTLEGAASLATASFGGRAAAPWRRR